VLAAAGLIVQYGQVQPWYILVAVARYFFVAGLWLRRRFEMPVFDLPPSLTRRMLAGLQMGFLALMLWPIFTPPGTYLAAVLFGLPFLLGFAQDWLYVSGALKPSGPARRTWAPAAALTARLTAVVLVGAPAVLWLSGQTPPGWNPVALSTGLIVAAGLQFAAVGLIGLGAAGRAAALFALILTGLEQLTLGFSLGLGLQVAALIAVLYLGTGPVSIWTPEDFLIYRRAGEKIAPPKPEPTLTPIVRVKSESVAD
jgi:CDP-diacylglycerol--glycerol-3-phosphate 3-phosphatidyltransferase